MSKPGLTSIEASQTVVSLQKRKATLRSKILLDVMEYWEGLRDGNTLPRRADVDPRRIEGALPYAFIAEEIAPGLARFRVAGGHLNDLMGMEVRGMPLSAVFAHTQRNRLLPMVESVFRGPKSLELTLVARRPGAEPTHAELLMLPLLDDDGAATRALGCLVAQGTLLSPPYRFQVTQSRTTPLPTPHVEEPAIVRPAVKQADRALVGFHEPTPVFASAPVRSGAADAPRKNRAPFLRVIK